MFNIYTQIYIKDFSFEISPYTFLKSMYLFFNEVLMMLIAVIVSVCSEVLSWQHKNPGLLPVTLFVKSKGENHCFRTVSEDVN